MQAGGKQRTADNLQCVGNHLFASFWTIVATSRAVGSHAKKTCGGQPFDLLFRPIALRRPREFVARELLNDEAP